MTRVRTMFRSGIHRARVTEANADHERASGLTAALPDPACIFAFERVHVLDINGMRLMTLTSGTR